MAMVARNGNGPSCQQLEEGLKSSDSSTRLQAVRELKNTVIGNRFKKQQFTGLVPALLELLTSSRDADLLVQAVAALGSLAYGVDDGVRAIVACNGVAGIVGVLCSSNERVVAAAARSLKLLYQSPLAPRDALLQQPVLLRLVALLQQPQHDSVAEAAANVLGHCCTSASQASSVAAAGAVPALVQLLSSQRRSCQESAVEAAQQETARQLLPACLSVLPRLVRLLSAADAAAAGAGVSHAATPAAAAAAAGSPAYRALLGLAGEAGDSRYLQQVPLLLALLMDGRPELRQLAMDLDAIKLLDAGSSEVQVAAAGAACNLLLGFSSVRQPLLKAGALPALSSLTASMLPQLRLYAAWALKNASHEAEPEVQQQLLQEMSWQGFRGLLVGDHDVRVQEQAVGLLQNLCKGAAGVEQVGAAWIGANFTAASFAVLDAGF
ncbi:hypothetical protein OEZ86_013860 [Tetradesmus obliquus]|nr:hypothetical protein OEZ86_013860 [Tetradesmus obliquus]